MSTHTRTVGDTLLPLNRILRDANGPLDLSAYDSVKFEMEADDGTSVIAQTTTGVTVHPTQEFTADAGTDLLTCTNHGVKTGDQVVLATSGTLPTGLADSTRYFAVQVTPNSFALAVTPDGLAIDITGAGSGTHTFYVVGSVQFTFSAGDVDTAGIYRAWFTLVDGTSTATFPDDEYGIRVEIKPKGN